MQPLLTIQDVRIPIEHHQLLDSTQVRARDILAQTPEAPLLITADRQTGGIGRTGRRWESPPGGLWVTLLWPLPDRPEPILESLGLRVGLACLRVVTDLLAQHAPTTRARLKWPNDVLLEANGAARKLGGVIVEIRHHPPRSYALVGVGLNLNNPRESLPSSLRPLTDTLRAHTSRDIPLLPVRDRLAHELVNALRSRGLTRAQLDEIRAALWGVGSTVSITLPDGSRVEGTLLGLTDDGRLQLARNGQPWLAPLSAELAPPHA